MALATLSIDLEARLAELETGLKRAVALSGDAAKRIEGQFNGLQALNGQIRSHFSGLFAGATITAAGAFVVSMSGAIDALNDVADATGSTIENISALEDLALRTGASLDDVSGILVKFNGALKEADGKNGVSVALEAIGLNADQLRKLDPAEALRQVAVALSGFKDDADKARLVQDLFGKSVKEAAPFLKDLAEQGTLVAKVTAQQAAEAEKFNRQLTEFKANIEQSARSISMLMIPAMNAWFKRWETAKDAFGGAGGALGAGVFGRLNFDDAAEGLQHYTGKLGELNQQLRALESAPSDGVAGRLVDKRTAENLRLQVGQVQNYIKYYQNLVDLQKQVAAGPGVDSRPSVGGGASGSSSGKGANSGKRTGGAPSTRGEQIIFGPVMPDATQRALDRLQNTDTERIRRLREELQDLLSIKRAGSGGPGIDEAILDVEEALNRYNPAAQAAIDHQRRLNEILDMLPSRKLEEQRAKMQALTELFNDGKLGEVTVNELGEVTAASAEAIETYNLIAGRLLELPDEIKPALDKSLDFTQQFAANVQDIMGDTLVRTMKGDFDSIANLWGDMVLKMLAQAAAANFNEALFGSSFVEGGLVKAGLAALGFVGFKDGAAFGPGGVRAFASGDVFNAPTMFSYGSGRLGVMGEAGPEAVMPLRRGRDGRLGVAAAGGGGGQIVINNTVYAGMTRSEVMLAMQASEARTKADLLSVMRRHSVN